MHAMGEPHVLSKPAERLDVLEGRAAEALVAVGLFVGRLCEVGVKAHSMTARQLAGAHEQLR